MSNAEIELGNWIIAGLLMWPFLLAGLGLLIAGPRLQSSSAFHEKDGLEEEARVPVTIAQVRLPELN